LEKLASGTVHKARNSGILIAKGKSSRVDDFTGFPVPLGLSICTRYEGELGPVGVGIVRVAFRVDVEVIGVALSTCFLHHSFKVEEVTASPLRSIAQYDSQFERCNDGSQKVLFWEGWSAQCIY